MRELAKIANSRAMEHGLYPVGIQVVSPEGELLKSASVNRAGLFGPAASPQYLRMLEGAIAAMEQ